MNPARITGHHWCPRIQRFLSKTQLQGLLRLTALSSLLQVLVTLRRVSQRISTHVLVTRWMWKWFFKKLDSTKRPYSQKTLKKSLSKLRKLVLIHSFMPVFGWNYDSILELSAGMHVFSLTFVGAGQDSSLQLLPTSTFPKTLQYFHNTFIKHECFFLYSLLVFVSRIKQHCWFSGHLLKLKCILIFYST